MLYVLLVSSLGRSLGHNMDQIMIYANKSPFAEGYKQQRKTLVNTQKSLATCSAAYIYPQIYFY